MGVSVGLLCAWWISYLTPWALEHNRNMLAILIVIAALIPIAMGIHLDKEMFHFVCVSKGWY